MFVTVLMAQARAADVRTVDRELGRWVSGLDANAVPLPEVLNLFEVYMSVARWAQTAMTLLAPRVEEAETWKRAGHRSAAEHLAVVAGTSVSVARAMLETSKQVAALPATADAMRAGRLSPAKAEAIASAATVAPEAEESLLSKADAPLAVVRDECLRAKAVDRDAAHARIRRDRFAREYTDSEGAWNFVARGTPEDGARFRFAHQPIVDEMFKKARREDRKETREAYAFDAFIELAHRAAAPEAGNTSKSSPRFMTLIRADLEALRRGWVEGDEVCEIAGLGPIPVATARDLLGDAVLKLVITKGVDVINVTHLGRSATAAQQAALWWQSPTCTAEECTRTRRLENDHEIGWAETRRTRVDELDPLCTHEHSLKTNHGWALVAGTGRRPFVPPDDPRHPKYRDPPDP